MVTPTSPKNMLIAGIILILLNVAALSPLSTGAVEGAVDDNFETFPKDSACYDDDCEEAEDDWASSTSQRDFYGWSVNNLDDVMANGSAPTYTEVGPVTYDITTTKTINSYDKEAGTLTYNSVKTFECNADSEVSCDHEVTQLNIAFQTQVIGATGMAINGIMDATKAGFTTGMLAKDLESLGAGSAASQAMSGLYAQTVTDVTAMGGTEAMANAGIGAGFYDGWNQYFALMNLSQMNNLSGQGETINYTAVSGATSNFSNLTYAFTEALMPGSGEDVSLLSSVGTMVFAGHCDAYPTSPENATVRAQIWQYLDTNEAATIANDYAMCFGIGGNFASTFGGGDATLGVGDTTGMAVNVSTRLGYLGITMDEMSATVMLFGDGDDVITGLLEVNDAGTEFGVANFLGMDGAAAMTAYGMDQATYESVYGWAASWFGDVTSLPMILLGGSGDMTASLFVNTTFGAEDPLNGGYLANSLNLGGGWAALGASGGNAVDLDPALSGNALYGPLGLTTSTGSAIFLYGELSGFTPPLNFSTNPPTPGAPMAWDENTIAALYGVDTNAANAMRALMMGPIYGTTSESFVPGFLMSSFGATPYLTQSFNSWLLGWHDPVSAFLATGNPMDMSAGWASLETNATYYGSAGIANGDGTNYTMCTGEVDTCDKGETLLEDGSTQLSWRNDAMFAATFGLIAPESLVNTTGGFVTGTGDLVDVSGYAIAEITCDGTGTVKNIPVDVCTATVDATKRSIQANLLETYSLLDATPGALPVYFGSNITMEAEQLSGLIIAGESTSTFYLDTRAHTNQASEPSMSDLVPVFQIKSASMIGASDAEDMESAIVTNQDGMAYWTNFDHPIDYLTLLFWIGGIALIAFGMISAANAPEDETEAMEEAKDHDAAMADVESEDASEEASEEASE
ncbi:CD36 family protein [Candidatus Poseidonia alphae]|nr:CD36 family protein [Candidatus Poseidonia alphae]